MTDAIPSGIEGGDGPEAHPGIAFCHCGEAWFSLEPAFEGDQAAIAVSSEDVSVIAYTGLLRCVGCGGLKPVGFRGDHPDQPDVERE